MDGRTNGERHSLSRTASSWQPALKTEAALIGARSIYACDGLWQPNTYPSPTTRTVSRQA